MHLCIKIKMQFKYFISHYTTLDNLVYTALNDAILSVNKTIA